MGTVLCFAKRASSSAGDHFLFAIIFVLLRKRHPSVLQAGEYQRRSLWRIHVPLTILACRGILRRFLVRLCKSNNIFLYCQIIRKKNDHQRSSLLALQSKVPGDSFSTFFSNERPGEVPSAAKDWGSGGPTSILDFLCQTYHLRKSEGQVLEPPPDNFGGIYPPDFFPDFLTPVPSFRSRLPCPTGRRFNNLSK